MTSHSNSPQHQAHPTRDQGTPGTELVVDIGPIAHGGHFVARHEGRVIFVRHAIPGEKVRIRLTDSGDSSRFWRADVVEVLEGSADRVPHFWKQADSLGSWSRGTAPVGGAELGHISLERQRSLKSEVLAEQLKRLAGLDLTTEVEAVGDNHDGGLGWRTRASFAVTPKGRLGMHAHRSDVVLPIKEMPLALAGLNELKLWDLDLSGIARVEVAVPANGSRPLILLAPEESTSPKRLHSIVSQLPPDVSVASFDPGKGEVLQLRGRTWVQETAAGHDYRVTGEGFWQIHKDAPDTLVGAVTGYLSRGRVLAARRLCCGSLRRCRAVYGTSGGRRRSDRFGPVRGRRARHQPGRPQKPAWSVPGGNRSGTRRTGPAPTRPQLRLAGVGSTPRWSRQGCGEATDGHGAPRNRLCVV